MHASLTVKVSSFNSKLSEICFCQSPFLSKNGKKWPKSGYGLFRLSKPLNLTLWPLYKAQRVLSDKTSFSTSTSEQRGEQDPTATLQLENKPVSV